MQADISANRLEMTNENIKDKALISGECSEQKEIMNHKFSTSFGLIVKTFDGGIVLLERKVPYCVQNFYVYLNKQSKKRDAKKYVAYTFNQIKKEFEDEWLPTLSTREKLEYFNFLSNQEFEDKFDFPHGQYDRRRFRNRVIRNEKHGLFLTAHNEFQEETGYRFSYDSLAIDRLKVIKLEFMGKDDKMYCQYYFIVENVRDLKRHTYFNSYLYGNLNCPKKIESWIDDRLIYTGKLMSFHEAYYKLCLQQNYKKDNKHLLVYLSNSTFYHNLVKEFRLLNTSTNEELNEEVSKTIVNY